MQAKERVRKPGASGTKAGGGDDGTTSKLQQKQAQMQQGKIEDTQLQQQQISTADYCSSRALANHFYTSHDSTRDGGSGHQNANHHFMRIAAIEVTVLRWANHLQQRRRPRKRPRSDPL